MLEVEKAIGSRAYYPAIDIVRFACAVSVVLYHLGFSSWFKTTSGGAKLVDHAYEIDPGIAFWWGSVGVQIFFVISGFVIAASANGASAFGFLRSRVERLYPGVWICGTLSALVWSASGVRPAGDMLHRYVREMLIWPKPMWVDGQLWTLVVEVGFYSLILVGILLRLTRLFPVIAAGFIVASTPMALAVAAQAAGFLHTNPIPRLFVGPQARALLGFGCYFGVGMLLWLRSVGAAPRWTLPFLLLGLIDSILKIGVSGRQVMAEFGTQLPWLGYAWMVPALVFCLSYVVIANARPVYLARGKLEPLPLRATRSLGLATYPLYLIHFGLGISCIRLLVATGLPAAGALVFVVIGLSALSLAIARFGEPVLRKLLRSASDWLLARYLVPRFVLRPGGAVTLRPPEPLVQPPIISG